MTRTLAPIGDDFFSTAGLVLKARIDLPHSPQQVRDALGSDQMGSRMAILDQAAWHAPRPLTTGARRGARLAHLVTLREEYYRWQAPLVRVTRGVVAAIGWRSLMAISGGRLYDRPLEGSF